MQASRAPFSLGVQVSSSASAARGSGAGGCQPRIASRTSTQPAVALLRPGARANRAAGCRLLSTRNKLPARLACRSSLIPYRPGIVRSEDVRDGQQRAAHRASRLAVHLRSRPSRAEEFKARCEGRRVRTVY